MPDRPATLKLDVVVTSPARELLSRGLETEFVCSFTSSLFSQFSTKALGNFSNTLSTVLLQGAWGPGGSGAVRFCHQWNLPLGLPGLLEGAVYLGRQSVPSHSSLTTRKGNPEHYQWGQRSHIFLAFFFFFFWKSSRRELNAETAFIGRV